MNNETLNRLGEYFFYLVVVLGFLAMLWDAWKATIDHYLKERKPFADDPWPWWIRFDRWLHYCEPVRVQNVVFACDFYFGGRLRKMGAAMYFTKD